MKLRKNLQRGFTMVELLVVFAIISIAGAVVWSTTGGAVDSAKAEGVADELVASSARISKRHSRMPAGTRYTGITLTTSEPALTENLRSSINSGGTAIALEYGTAAISATNNVGATGSTNFMWTLTGLPRIACEEMLNKIAPAATVVLSAATGTTQVRNRATDDAITAAELNTVCANNAASNAFRAIF